MTGVALLPALAVRIGGDRLDAVALRALRSVDVRQRVSAPAQCELAFVDPPPALRRLLAGGEPSPLSVVREQAPEPLFEGAVTAVELTARRGRPAELWVRGYDDLHALRERQEVRSFEDVSVADLARRLAPGLKVREEDLEALPTWPRLVQHADTDLELLRREAARHGVYFALRGRRLHLFTLAGFGAPVRLRLGAELLEATGALNRHGTCGSVSVASWDPGRGEPVEARAETPRRPAGGADGSGLAAEGPLPDRRLAGWVAPGRAHALALAQGALDAGAARRRTVRGMAEGDERVRPGAVVEVDGLGEPFDGAHVVTSADHRVDDRGGYRTEFSTAPPERDPPATEEPRLAQGVVSAVDDPESRGRVRVWFPGFAEVESEWLSVVVPGAGAGKGLVALPDVDDRVLVLFPAGTPADGLVLGGLYAPGEPPDDGVEGGRTRRFTLVTAGGRRLVLDDAGQRVRVEEGEAGYLELGPEGVVLHAGRNLTIEAPGHAIRIAGASIDLERA
jgi:phage protein D/phage baseplate assembly protein gpV